MAESDVCIDLVKRSQILEALQDDALDQRTLERRTGSSQSTTYRIIGWLTELGVVEKSRGKFALTATGETVAKTVATFKTDDRLILHDETIDSGLLTDLIRCFPVLEALREDSLDRREIEVQLGISNSTSHRYTRTLGERSLIEKSKGRFDLTESGEAVADVVAQFKQGMETTVRLAPMLETVGETAALCPIEAFTDATVTTVGHGDSYSHLKRVMTLVEETNTLRGIDLDSIAPFYIDELTQPILDGMETEAIDPPDVLEKTMDNYPYVCAKVCVNGDFTPWLHDDLPFGLVIFDDCVGIGVCDPGSRRLRMFVDTDSVAVREWAENIFESYKTDAVRLEQYTKKGLREALTRQESTASG